MKRTETSKISEALRERWPGLSGFWAPTDTGFKPVKNLERFMELMSMFPETRPWKKDVNECEEIAWRFVMRVRDHEYDTSQTENEQIGWVSLLKVNGVEMNHTINIGINEDGSEIYLGDMQTGQAWIANSENDDIYMGVI